MGVMFNALIVEGGELVARVPGKGWYKIQSINGVPTKQILSIAQEQAPEQYEREMGALLPSVMAATEGPLAGDVTVVAENKAGKEETLTLHYDAKDRQAVVDALRKNFEGIVAMAKAAELNEDDIGEAFAAALQESKKEPGAEWMEMQHMMGNMMQNAMGNAGSNGGDFPGPVQCEQQ